MATASDVTYSIPFSHRFNDQLSTRSNNLSYPKPEKMVSFRHAKSTQSVLYETLLGQFLAFKQPQVSIDDLYANLMAAQKSLGNDFQEAVFRNLDELYEE